MSEQQIEQVVSAMTDALDRRYLTTSMTEEEYRAGLDAIAIWADSKYREARLSR